MCRINCEIIEGLIPSEKTAYIQSADGRIEEVAISSSSVYGNVISVSEVGRAAGKVLVELPRESASGKWRMWVNEGILEG